MTISGLNKLFDHPLCFSILSDQAVNDSVINNFAPILSSRLLLYHHYCPRSLPHQAVNDSSIDIPTNRRSRFMSSSTSSQTSIGVDTP